ncbi:MAG: TadE/TadG family type IV pilus assembly protein [Rhizobiaceae bacterium]
MIELLKRFAGNRRGNFAVTFGVMAPVLFGLIGLSIDYSIFFSQKSQMQEAADNAALAAVREAALQGWGASIAKSVAEEFVEETLTSSGISAAVYTSDVAVDEAMGTVKVAIRQDGHGYFLLGLFKSNPQIAVSSNAAIVSSTNICIVGLDETEPETLLVDGKSKVTGDNCSIYSNSTSNAGMTVMSASNLTALDICSSGGAKGVAADYTPNPITDCPAVPDPLASRPAPAVGSCDHTDFAADFTTTIFPGVYCGGIKLTGGTVTASPGVYVIKDGVFEIGGSTVLKGTHVGFYLTGTEARTVFGTATTIDLTAPKTGPLAGILIFEDRNSTTGREFLISSKDAKTIVGTVYLPKGTLAIRNAGDIGTASDWTAIIARKIVVDKDSVLRLNSDYAGSTVPVPEGISGGIRNAYLTD